MNLLTLCLCAALTRPCIDNVNFTVYEQEEPHQVVFLMAGDATNDEWWFSDLSLFEEYKDTLFIGVGQSYTLEEDLRLIINFVRSRYDILERDRWSFFGFSLGAYETYNVALEHYHDVFGNYAAVGGGCGADLECDPEICFLYVCYGSGDCDKSSADFAANALLESGYICSHNYKKEVLEGVGHSKEEARLGLTNFLKKLNTNRIKTIIYQQAGFPVCFHFNHLGDLNEKDRRSCPVHGEGSKRQQSWLFSDLALAGTRHIF